MTANEQGQNIIALPLQERAIAVALKHVFDQIKKIQQDQQNQIQALNHSYNNRFKSILNKTSAIIKGTTLTNQQLTKNNYLLREEEKNEVEAICQSKQGINKYWVTALTNFYGQDLTEADQQIATALKDITTNITKDTIEVTFDLGLNEWISPAIITKRFTLQQGIVTAISGDSAVWIKPQTDGIFKIIWCQNQLCDLNDAFTIANQLVNEVVPYSLQYYLGATEQIDQQQLLEQLQNDDQEDSVPTKKLKE